MGDVVNKKKTVSIIVLSLIIDLLAFTCILPLFPSILSYYAKQNEKDFLYETFTGALNNFQVFIGAPISERYNYVFFGGILGSLFCFLQFISSPTLGTLSDYYGRKPMLLLSCFGSFISYFVWLNASTFTIFFISRIIGGLSKTNTNVTTAMIGDIYKKEENAKGMALIGISYSIGFLIGPMIGAYFSTLAKQEAFFTIPAKFAIALTIIEFLIILTLPETIEKTKDQKVDSNILEKAQSLLVPNALFKFQAVDSSEQKRKSMEKFGWVYFLFLFIYSGLEFTLPFLTHIRFDYNSVSQGKIYLFTGTLMLIFQGGISRRLPMEKQKKLGEFGMLVAIPAFLLIAIAESITCLYLGLFFFALASATVVPSLTSCLTSINQDSDRGAVIGVFRSIGSLARAIGPIVASTVFWLAGPMICYIIGGISLLIPLYLLKGCANPIKFKE